MESAFKKALNKNGTEQENTKRKARKKKDKKVVRGGKKVSRDIHALSKDLDKYLTKSVSGWNVMVLNIMPKIDVLAQNNIVPVEIQSQVEGVLGRYGDKNVEKLARISKSIFILQTLLKIQTTRSIKIKESGTSEEKRRSERVLWIVSKKLLGQKKDLSKEDKEIAASSFAQVEAFRNVATRSIHRRITHCWRCGEDDLDSDTNNICPECGGIICHKCGACHMDCYGG